MRPPFFSRVEGVDADICGGSEGGLSFLAGGIVEAKDLREESVAFSSPADDVDFVSLCFSVVSSPIISSNWTDPLGLLALSGKFAFTTFLAGPKNKRNML